MSYIMTVKYFHDETLITIHDESKFDYTIRGSRLVRSNNIKFTLRAFLQSKIEIPFDVSVLHLMDLDEDVLFQESLITAYDPYYVKAAMHYIRDTFSTVSIDSPYSSTHEYYIIQLDF